MKKDPHTLETLRLKDLTTVQDDDDEVHADEEADEFATYFSRSSAPKILITTSDKARKVLARWFCIARSLIIRQP